VKSRKPGLPPSLGVGRRLAKRFDSEVWREVEEWRISYMFR
jgi:hypothetical protein